MLHTHNWLDGHALTTQDEFSWTNNPSMKVCNMPCPNLVNFNFKKKYKSILLVSPHVSVVFTSYWPIKSVKNGSTKMLVFWGLRGFLKTIILALKFKPEGSASLHVCIISCCSPCEKYFCTDKTIICSIQIPQWMILLITGAGNWAPLNGAQWMSPLLTFKLAWNEGFLCSFRVSAQVVVLFGLRRKKG